MRYPIMEQVAHAPKYDLARWARFLPSPGEHSIGLPSFHEDMAREAGIMDAILKRFNELGGWTPELSKEIGHATG